MTDHHWTYIWHQAITHSFMDGKTLGRNKTSIFMTDSPVNAQKLCLQFSNRYGSVPYMIGAARIFTKAGSCPVTVNGNTEFEIPCGGLTASDPCDLSAERGEKIQIRLFFKNTILDSNNIEDAANLVPGNQTEFQSSRELLKPLPLKLLGIPNSIPAIEAVEALTDEPAGAIVAFGDSITAMSRWTKPLAKRLDEAYPGEYVLLNSGISGNCLLYRVKGKLGDMFGEKGTDRFKKDVLDIPNLHAVIIALGVNDVSYLSEETADLITRKNFIREITAMTDILHEKGVRVVIQTISPRLGVARSMGKYTRDMEELRLQLNGWIRTAGIFDYVFDAEAVVRQEHSDGYYYAEGLHQGDHLHPNAEGGKLLAEAYDLEQLTGQIQKN